MCINKQQKNNLNKVIVEATDEMNKRTEDIEMLHKMGKRHSRMIDM